ncbi:MAG TPA: metallophosphoesterase [Gemmatimonadaceae bacterium]|nr:metallophosphoesterase [Gemmatimonadaceae bacterium]
MKLWVIVFLLPLSAIVAACSRDEGSTPPPIGASAREVALSGSVVLIGAGDIAVCGESGDEQTAAIIDSVLRVDSVANLQNVVISIGDNAYPSGTATQFARCFTNSWGDAHKRIMKYIRPAPGNHEYRTRGAEPYFKYFGEKAGPPGKGYYSFDFGDWHVLSLNSELVANPGRAAERREQEDWLKEDLATHQRLCTLAYFHRPLFSSGEHGNEPSMRTLWKVLYDHGVDLIINGHEHNYERFLPQTPAGVADSVRGIEEIVVGTGGGDLRGMRRQRARNSAAAIHGYFGVIKLSLGAGEYRRAFIDTQRRIWDEGGRKCH